MNIPLLVKEPVLEYELLCRQQFKQMLLWLTVTAYSIFLIIYIKDAMYR